MLDLNEASVAVPLHRSPPTLLVALAICFAAALALRFFVANGGGLASVPLLGAIVYLSPVIMVLCAALIPFAILFRIRPPPR
ncbi:MAG: hypothetical protein JOZ05_06755 [Acetobacteraceae bacterium]|nr:hypothetical protein [Acetobacteraceae bacterium]